jgi:hypothetical protein
VGGTNPSLVEALGASLPVLAHDNKFNRWVAGEGAHYFTNIHDCASLMHVLCVNEFALLESRENSINQFENRFRWNAVHQTYERLLEFWLQPSSQPRPVAEPIPLSLYLTLGSVAMFSLFILMVK